MLDWKIHPVTCKLNLCFQDFGLLVTMDPKPMQVKYKNKNDDNDDDYDDDHDGDHEDEDDVAG